MVVVHGIILVKMKIVLGILVSWQFHVTELLQNVLKRVTPTKLKSTSRTCGCGRSMAESRGYLKTFDNIRKLRDLRI